MEKVTSQFDRSRVAPTLFLWLVAGSLFVTLCVFCTLRAIGPVSCTSKKNDLVIRCLKFTEAPRVPDIQPESVFIRSFETRPLKNIIRMHRDNVGAYASQQGYNYAFTTEKPHFEPTLPINWVKLQLAQHIFRTEPMARVFVWIDVNALVVHNHITVNDIIRESPSSSIYIGKDSPNRKKDPLCAGIFFIRNTSVGRQFVDDCLTQYMQNTKCMNSSGEHTVTGAYAGECYEQGVMNQLCKSDMYKDHVYILDRSAVTNHITINPNSWISHIYIGKPETEEVMRNFITANEKWLPLRRATTVRGDAPVRACIILTAYATPERISMYTNILHQWINANVKTPIYVIDSAGLNLLANIITGQKNYTYVCFQQPTTLPQKNRPSLTERTSLERLMLERPEILQYNMCFKITCKYFVPNMDAIIARVPHGTDMVLQYTHTRKEEHTECIGMTPTVLQRVLQRVNKNTSLEHAVILEIKHTPDLKRFRLQPVPIPYSHRVKRNNRSTLKYL